MQSESNGKDEKVERRQFVQCLGIGLVARSVASVLCTSGVSNGSYIAFNSSKSADNGSGGRCPLIFAYRFSDPESDGTQELTLYVDRENYIPIGVVVKGKVDPATGNRELQSRA